MSNRRHTLGLGLLLAAAAATACGKKEAAPPPVVQTPLGEQHRVRHILVQYTGAAGASAEVTRTKAAAESLATSLRSRVERGEEFGGLARQFSDDGSAAEGGEIAPLVPGETPPVFERAAFALKPGEMSPVVESEHGFHLIQRLGAERIAVQHILVRYRGAQGAPDSLQRSRVEALGLADTVLTLVQNPEASFPVAAARFSEDEMTAPNGGYLGEFARGKMTAAFDEAAFALAENQISGIVEDPYGFHIIRRVPVETIRVRHILITHALSDGLEVTPTRTAEEALQRALDVLFRARKGEDFEALARELSEDRMTGPKGGILAPIARGQTVPEFEEAAFSLRPGEISDVVQTSFGFHVIKREN